MMEARPWDLPAPEPDRPAKPGLLGMDRTALADLLASMGEPAWRGNQLFEGIYRHRWASWDRFTAFGKALRERLEASADLARPRIVESSTSGDGSTKHAFQLADGHLIEGVHMPYAGRTTLCLSSQVGCALGCTFCATGQMGIKRNLAAGEIIGQVLAMLDHHGHPQGTPVNLVFMGMGEPMHNLDHVMAAFRILSDPAGLAIPARRITLSTAGLVSGIQRLGGFSPRPRLAVSLNATTDRARSEIMPVNRVWNLDRLAEALQAFPLARGERITLEFVLLKGVTDALEDGRRLAAFACRFPSKVNLIPFNAHEGSGFEPPEEARLEALCALLVKAGVTVSVRRSRGQDVAGACGQLVRGRRRKAVP
jgi:23S rRNA (adenine2503-C2)-methyltransferase